MFVHRPNSASAESALCNSYKGCSAKRNFGICIWYFFILFYKRWNVSWTAVEKVLRSPGVVNVSGMTRHDSIFINEITSLLTILTMSRVSIKQKQQFIIYITVGNWKPFNKHAWVNGPYVRNPNNTAPIFRSLLNFFFLNRFFHPSPNHFHSPLPIWCFPLRAIIFGRLFCTFVSTLNKHPQSFLRDEKND